MRNNHDKKNHKLAKRTFALCLALAVICSCLLPVFATEGGLVASWNEAAASDDGGIAVQPGGIVVDGGSSSESTASGTSGVELPAGATDFVDNGDGTYTYKDAAGNTVKGWFIGKDDKTTWTDGEVTITPNDNLKQDDAAFGVLPIEYHFWLRQLDSFELSNLAWETEVSDYGTETEYLAVFGDSTGFPIWHMDTISSVDTISNYKFDNPTSKDDPTGEGREFAYWYTVDSTGLKHQFDPYKSYGSTTNTVINVYAAWKDASGDVVEDTKKDETKTDTAKTSEVSGKAKLLNNTNVELTITAKGLPAAATHLTVSNMGTTSMEQFNNLYTSLGGKLTPFLGFKISPKDAGGNTVEPTGTVTVTISGLGSLNLDALPGLKVLHQTVSHTVETLDASYDKATGTLTFQTTSFSPFVIAFSNEGNQATTLEIKNQKIAVGEEVTVEGNGKDSSSWFWSETYTHEWNLASEGIVEITATSANTATFKGLKEGTVTVTHRYKKTDQNSNQNRWQQEIFTITVTRKLNAGEEEAQVYFLYDMTKDANENNTGHWRGPILVGGNNAVVKTAGATWENGMNGSTVYTNKNIKQNVSNYIMSWPDGATGATWELSEAVRKQTITGGTIEDVVFANFKQQLKDAGMTQQQVDALTVDQIKITLVPYKISQSNGTTPDKHIDCNIVITCPSAYTAKFKVKKSTDSIYETRSTHVYVNSDPVLLCNGDSAEKIEGYAPESYVDDNGVTWLFDGWYPEKIEDDGTELGQKTGEPDLNAEHITFDYSPTDKQLGEDRVVNFYARYVRASADLTISKTVTGIFGDHDGTFKFKITDKAGKPVNLTTDNFKVVKSGRGGDAVGLTNDGNDGEFTLADEAVVIIKNLNDGDYIVTELNAADYTTTWELTNTPTTGTAEATADTQEAATSTTDKAKEVKMAGVSQTLACTNDRTLPVDEGVLLDTLPYIVILAVVVGGGALLLMRKRRKDEDD